MSSEKRTGVPVHKCQIFPLKEVIITKSRLERKLRTDDMYGRSYPDSLSSLIRRIVFPRICLLCINFNLSPRRTVSSLSQVYRYFLDKFTS